MSSLKFSEDHAWISVDAGVATVGITDYAQDQLGDIVYIEVPVSGRKVSKGEECAVIESVKAASEIHAPVSGEVVEHNVALADAPEIVNKDPLGGGWCFRIKISNPSEIDELMDEAVYKRFIA